MHAPFTFSVSNSENIGVLKAAIVINNSGNRMY